jgi:hypothetical protein
MANWVDQLIADVQRRQELIDKIVPRVPAALEKLRSVIQQDIDRLNNDLYEGRPIFEIEDAPVPFYDFRVTRVNSKFEAQVRLHADELELKCSILPSGRGLHLSALADLEGGISFFDGNQLVPLEEISRTLIEPAIRAEFNLN